MEELVRQAREKLQEVDRTANPNVARDDDARCSRCVAETLGATFCAQCGASLAATLTGSVCSTQAKAGTTLWAACSTPIST